jgi:hypothetical protein
MLITLRRVRNRLLDLKWEVKEPLALRKHPVDDLIWDAVVDEVGKADVSASGVESVGDVLCALEKRKLVMREDVVKPPFWVV